MVDCGIEICSGDLVGKKYKVEQTFFLVGATHLGDGTNHRAIPFPNRIVDEAQDNMVTRRATAHKYA